MRAGPFTDKNGLDHVPVGPHLRRRPGTAQLVLPWSRVLKCLANRLTGVVQLRGDLADGPPFAKVQMSDRLNIDHLEHLLSSLTPKLLLEVRVMDWVLGVVPFSGITARSTVPF